MTDDLAVKLAENIARTEASLDDSALIVLNIKVHRLVAEATTNPARPIAPAPIGNLLFGATQNLAQSVPAARHHPLAAHQQLQGVKFASGTVQKRGVWQRTVIGQHRTIARQASAGHHVEYDISATYLAQRRRASATAQLA